MAGHAPMLAMLKAGEMTVRTGSQMRHFAVSGGFLEVAGKSAVVLADSVELASEIDLPRAEEARTRAIERLHKREPGLDVSRAISALERANNRIRLIRKYK
jgi:F-type H+-transporting ATPase subunit epsilon